MYLFTHTHLSHCTQWARGRVQQQLDRSSAYHRADTYRQTTIHSHIHTFGNSGSPVHLTCRCLAGNLHRKAQLTSRSQSSCFEVNSTAQLCCNFNWVNVISVSATLKWLPHTDPWSAKSDLNRADIIWAQKGVKPAHLLRSPSHFRVYTQGQWIRAAIRGSAISKITEMMSV